MVAELGLWVTGRKGNIGRGSGRGSHVETNGVLGVCETAGRVRAQL